MKAWLVRWAGDETEYQVNVIGIVFANSFHDLWESIDEITNPHEVEYCRIPRCRQIGVFLGRLANTTTDTHSVSDVFVGADADLEWTRGKWKTFVELIGDYDAFYSSHYRFPGSKA